MNKHYICTQQDCAMYNSRLVNKCEALSEAYEYGEICPFYKSYDQYDEERTKLNQRKKVDEGYRRLVEYYASEGKKSKKL